MRNLIFKVLIFCCCANALLAQNQLVIDSLTQLITTNKENTHTIYYSELAWEYLFYDIDKAHQYAEKAVQIAEKYKKDTDLSEAYNTISSTAYRKGDYDKSIQYSKKAIIIREKLGDTRGLGASYSKLGIVYTDQGYFEKALEIQLKALDYFLQAKDKGAEAQTYNNICQIYNYLNNFEMAIFYADKCLKLYEEIDFPYGKASATGNKGIYFEKQNRLDSALLYHEMSRALFVELGYNVEIANCENALGVIYRKMGNNEKGLFHYTNAYNYAALEDDRPSMCQYAANMAAVQLDLGQLDAAFTNYTTALKYAEEKDIQRVKRQCYDGFANYYEKKGDYKQALHYRKLYEKIHEAITNEETQKAMAKADAMFQNTINQQKLAEQDAQLAHEKALSEKERLAHEAQLNKTRLWLTLSIGIALLITIGIVAFFTKKRLQREKLFAENMATEQERGLQMTLSAQEEERQRIARDLHDGIVQELTVLKMNINQLAEQPELEIMKQLPIISEKLDNASKEVRNISHQMMPLALRELGLSAALQDVLEKVLKPHSIQYEFDETGMEDRLPKVIEISLYRIAQELLNNVVKHSRATVVQLTLTKRNGYITLLLEDNGMGFSKEKSSTGIGMTSLNSRVKMINGEIKFDSETGSGTTAIIRIPLTK
jgi:signal transduction histidine kinase